MEPVLRVGVCSWSLHPNSPDELAEKALACGVDTIQLALDPIRRGEHDLQRMQEVLTKAKLAVASGMMAMKGEDYTTLQTIEQTGGVLPDEHWEENLTAARQNAALAAKLSLPLVTFHAGILPHDAGDPRRKAVLERVRAVADCFRQVGVATALETGQETAETLDAALRELPGIGVNFDAANMILYGKGDPREAVRVLARHVVQYHVKDAIPAKAAGTWGTEVRQGTGAVGWKEFLVLLRGLGILKNLLIEREAGGDRIDDIRGARELIREALGT
jgi:sugar phosphate isomerase/epimerase